MAASVLARLFLVFRRVTARRGTVLNADRPKWRDLDSKSGQEGVPFEPPLMPRLLPKACVRRRRGEPIAGHQNGVKRVERGYAAPHVLSKELRRMYCYPLAFIGAGVRDDARRGGRELLVVACARGGHVRVTPCPAQQRGVWPNRQCQHDRNYKCSKR